MIEIGRLKIDRLIMPFQNKHVYCLLLALTLVSSFLSFPDYEFKVFPVETCPLNKEDWNNSSARLNCNSTRLYYCLPNRDLTSLIEFCYPRGGKQLFMAGNCLELAGAGYLNHFSCNDTFLSGCPDTFYIGDEIFKYPKCLAINVNLRCFDSDTQCIKSRLVEYNAAGQIDKREKNISDERRPKELAMNSSENITELTENKTIERNKTVEQLGNSTLNNSEDSKILIGKHFEMSNTTKPTENLTKTNFEDYSVLVIILSSLLSISVFVLVVGIVKKILKAYPIKRNTFRRENKDESKKTAEKYTPSIPSSRRHSYDVCRQGQEKDDEFSLKCEEEINEESSTYINRTNSKPLDFDKTDERVYIPSSGPKKRSSNQSCQPNALPRSADEENDDDIYEPEVVPSSGPKKRSSNQSCQPNALPRSADEENDYDIYEPEVGPKKRSSNQSCQPNALPRSADEENDDDIYEPEVEVPSKSRLIDERPPLPLPKECLKEKQPRKMLPLPDDEEIYSEPYEGLLNAPFHGENIEGDNGMSPLKQSTNHRQRRQPPSIPTTSEVRPLLIIQKRRPLKHGKPPIPQPRIIIKQQSREPRNYSHQQVESTNETVTSESENLSDHIAVSGASETSTTLTKKCLDFVVDFLTILGSDLKSRQLKLSDENSHPENSPLLQNASSDQLKNSKSGSNMRGDVDKDYSERNDDVMNFQNESRKGRLRPGESRIKEKDWDANQEKTQQTNVYTHPQNWSELESKQRRLSVKRPYDSREGKEEFWMKSKRPVVTETRFASNSTSTSDRFFGGSRGRGKTVDSGEIEGLSDDRQAMDNLSRDNRPKRRPTVRFERENDRSSTRYDSKESCHHVHSDRRKKIYRDRRKTRTLPIDNGHEWKSKRENAVMETSFSRDTWQVGGNSPNEENMSMMEITYNPGQGPLGSPSDSQRNWDSIAERRKKDSSWSASKQKENRILGFEPQDRLNRNNLALQPNTWQQGFGQQMTSGHLETRVPVMLLAPSMQEWY